MLDRAQVQNIDWILIFLLVFNSLIGVLFIYSSSHYLPGNFHLRQLFWIFVGLIALFLFLSIDYIMLVTYSLYFYLALVFILAGMLLFGVIIAGTRSWIKLPFFQIQPSELMKIALILLFAHVFSEFRNSRLTWDKAFVVTVLAVPPLLLVSLQPDLGTALSFLPIILGSLFLAGLNRKIILALLLLSLVIGGVGWNFLLKDYQKDRLTTLVFPSKDPLGTGYHALQSKIAIGSGGFAGKGFKKGTQSQLRFLPARHTDFIFSVLGEEFGFLGVLGIMAFYFLLLMRLFQSVAFARDRAGVYIIFLTALMITAQFFINVLMTVGLFPIAGIPLPIISYGGSSLLTNYLAVSLVLNVKMRRFASL